ncbi:hypothetical protein [Rhodococcus sp. IEGM 1379]|uniref:hypothetical protein n=1 Tax=Rhodococcus sp. IEGM 1379 TaxID=3047086 RepID=UPI0024B6A2FA|nr:hypothetical protein [Rhodococcus sp. IEGM 1379]MDI9915395.1 hypothetical protein [Rhodococcus sp. IEGM 1379]
MSTNTANPVLAPIRRWVLYSRTNLTITIISAFAVLFVAGSLFGQCPTTAHTASASNTTTTAATDAAVAGDLTYELTEVTESTIAGKSVAAVSESAPATAMAYAHIYVDRSLSNSEWKTKLGKHTAEAPGVIVVNARPLLAVAITGPTRSESVAGTGGESAVQVIVPTQTGNLRITLKPTDSDKGSVWQVQSPLPTLDLSEVDKLDVPPLASAPTSKAQTTTSAPKSTTSSAAASATTTQAPSTTTTNPSTSIEPAPVPVPGPIPIPDLDTPLPGTL